MDAGYIKKEENQKEQKEMGQDALHEQAGVQEQPYAEERRYIEKRKDQMSAPDYYDKFATKHFDLDKIHGVAEYSKNKKNELVINIRSNLYHSKTRIDYFNKLEKWYKVINTKNLPKFDPNELKNCIDELVLADEKALRDEYKTFYNVDNIPEDFSSKLKEATQMHKHSIKWYTIQIESLQANPNTLAKGEADEKNLSNVELELRKLEKMAGIENKDIEPVNAMMPLEIESGNASYQPSKNQILSLNKEDWGDNLSERNRKHIKLRLYYSALAFESILDKKRITINKTFSDFLKNLNEYIKCNKSLPIKSREFQNENLYLKNMLELIKNAKVDDTCQKEFLEMIKNFLVRETGGYLDISQVKVDTLVDTDKIIENTSLIQNNKINLRKTNKESDMLFPHEPCISDIQQGYVNDCYILSALTSIVATSPQKVKESMRDCGDGNVIVRFYDYNDNYKPIYIKVRKELCIDNETEEPLLARNSLWVNMIEVAYASSGLMKDLNKKDPFSIDFGVSTDVMSAFLGNEAKFNDFHSKSGNGSIKEYFINYKLAPLTMFQNILTTESDTIKKLKDIFKVLKDDELNKMKVEELQEYYKTVCGSDYGVLSNVILQDRENMRIDIYENMVKKLKLYFQFMPKKMFENYYNIVCNPEKLTEEQSKHKYKYEDKAEIIKQYEYCGKVMEKFWSDFYNFYGNKLEPKSDVKGIIPVKKSDVIIKSTAKRLFDEYNLFLKEITAHSNLDTVISNLMNQIPNIAITEENKNHYISFIKEYIQECIEVMYDQKRVNKEDLVDKESPYLEQRYTDKAEIFYNNLQSLLMQKKLIQAGSLDIFTKTPENDEYNYFGLSAKHYYTVLGVHTQIINGENIKLIRLRDPRAVETLGYKILDKKLIPFKQKEYTNGIFLIELNDFIKYFKTIGNN